SIGRALTFSGVPSIVMSLWKIPDKETRALMEGFYQGLATSQQKHVALSQAKLSYLDAIQQVELAHPYFWAGFISSGNIASLEIPHQQSPWLVWVALALVGVLAGIWGYAKIRKGPQEVV
ncbi:MAG: CHAT domain-containing protein, partial [Bacteroidota bacterium]